VEKSVDNYVENDMNYAQNKNQHSIQWDIHRVILHYFERFPYIFAEKKYKLIIFAPDLEIVDK
jgi:hypothetical protein